MVNYTYRAVDHRGSPITGRASAVDEEKLESDLRDQGYWLIKAEKIVERATQGLGRIRASRRDLINFTTSMKSLLLAGVPAADAVRDLGTEGAINPFSRVLASIGHSLESGMPFHEALALHRNVFPLHIVSVVRAGEESGTLPEAFGELHRYLVWVEKMVGQVRQATTYPAALVFALGLFTILLFTFVIPRFVEVLESVNVPLPLITVLVIAASDFIAATWWLWGLLLLALPITLRVTGRHVPAMAYVFDGLILRLPVFGEMIRMIALSRFTHNFSVLFRAGIPILRCFELSRALVGNRVYERAITDVTQAVSQGSSIAEALRRHALFPPMVIQMFAVGEKTGNLNHTLETITDYFNEEVSRRIAQVFGIMEPLLTMVLVGLVGLVALAMFLPLIHLMSGLH